MPNKWSKSCQKMFLAKKWQKIGEKMDEILARKLDEKSAEKNGRKIGREIDRTNWPENWPGDSSETGVSHLVRNKCLALGPK